MREKEKGKRERGEGTTDACAAYLVFPLPFAVFPLPPRKLRRGANHARLVVSSPAMSAVSVDFQGVSKRFGNRSVLTAASGTLQRGRVLVVAGPNGAGKSTLLNILAGLLRPSRGEVVYREGGSPLPRAHWFERLGMAAPDMSVYEELSALENLRFFARLRGLHLEEPALQGLLEGLGLAPKEQKRAVGTYSSGMKQRVKLAQAVLHEPPVLLLDEPSSNLDESGHGVVADLVVRFRERAAVAVATNDPREMAWADARIDLAL
jgi:heme exporter protein A